MRRWFGVLTCLVLGLIGGWIIRDRAGQAHLAELQLEVAADRTRAVILSARADSLQLLADSQAVEVEEARAAVQTPPSRPARPAQIDTVVAADTVLAAYVLALEAALDSATEAVQTRDALISSLDTRVRWLDAQLTARNEQLVLEQRINATLEEAIAELVAPPPWYRTELAKGLYATGAGVLLTKLLEAM